MHDADWIKLNRVIDGIYTLTTWCSLDSASYLWTIDGTVGGNFLPHLLATRD